MTCTPSRFITIMKSTTSTVPAVTETFLSVPPEDKSLI